MSLRIVPISFADARAFVEEWHRHHKPPPGHKFSLGVAQDSVLVGVAIVGRPVARWFDNGRTLEVNRTATDGTPNANSMLYGACWRAAKAPRLRPADHLHPGRRVGFVAASRWLAGCCRTSASARLGCPVSAA